MKIGIDVRIWVAGFSGIPNYSRSILEQLQQLDQHNEYILFAHKPVSFKIVNPRWKIVILRTILPVPLYTQMVLPFVLRRERIDIFWAVDFIAPIWKASKVKYFVSVYDLTSIHFPKTMEWKRLLSSRLFFTRSMRGSYRILTISDFITRDILRVFPKTNQSKILQIPCGSPNWEIPGDYSAANRKDYLLFIGTCEPRKNLVNLIKSLTLLKANGKAIRLKLIGAHGWRNSHIHSALNSNKLADDIEFLGIVNTDRLKQELLSCKSLIFPSIYEGFGIPVVEALALDCTVITSKASAMEEVAGPAALYCNPDDPVDIARAIALVYDNRFDRNSLLKHRDPVLQRYQWSRSAGTLLESFNNSASFH